jgi:leucyl aminopeptidase (aminopeptidase T)
MILNKKQKLTSAQTVVRNVLGIKKDERVLIVANPETTVIAQSLYEASLEVQAESVLIFQKTKTAMDSADPAVIAALKTEPHVFMSISNNKLGKDPETAAHPYVTEDGISFDHIFDYLLNGKITMRAVWTPGLTEDMFSRTVQIDYKLLADRAKKLCARYKDVATVHVTAPAGTDAVVTVKGREPLTDNGDFSAPGSGGNIPAGEVFISPVVGTMQGTIVYDGSMTFNGGDELIKSPITVHITDGFVDAVAGGEQANHLLKDITDAEQNSIRMEKEGKLPDGQGAVYKHNARNIGELGIGLNPAATITGNMLEDEKAFRTCHFAIGANYDNDAPSLIHLDGVVRNPTIIFTYTNGSTYELMKDGEIKL